ncbi:MAG: cache domain-containing protein [Elusimicrobiota bacterium]
MKKRIFFSLIIFGMFLIPFLILSNHFINTVNEINLNGALSRMEFSINSISSKLADTLIKEYDVLKNIRDSNIEDSVIRSKAREILNSSTIVKKISVFSLNGSLIYSTDAKEKKSLKSDRLFETAKDIKIPVGIVAYPDNSPPELIMGEKISDKIIITVMDLGFLNEQLIKISRKLYGSIYLVDGDNNIIFDSNYDYIFNSGTKINENISTLISSLISRNLFSYKGIISINGEKTLIAISNIEGTKWWLINTTHYEKMVDMGLISWAKRVVYLGIALFIVFSYISVLLMERFYNA